MITAIRTRARAVTLATMALLGFVAHPARLGAQTTVIPPQVENMARMWAPLVLQATDSPSGTQTSFKINHFAAVDFDGDADMSNNTDHAEALQPWYNTEATVYYSAVETGDDFGNGYFFLNYYFYHVQDTGTPWVGNYGHTHDMEGVQLLIKKSPYTPRGYIVSALTEAHGGLLPYLPWQLNWGNPQPAGGFAAGELNFLRDSWPNGTIRPVIVSAARSHGVYAPQACGGTYNPNYPDPYGKGVDYDASIYYQQYVICEWPAARMILYRPQVHPEDGVTRAAGDELYGAMTYRFVELYQSVIWQGRTQSNMFSGTMLSLAGGAQGLKYFNAVGEDHAQPPWAWQGKASCPVNTCWIYWGQEGTTSGTESVSPESSIIGGFLTAPDQETALRFNNIPNLNLAMRYNPYLASPPDYSIGSVAPLSASVSGPSAVPRGRTFTWDALPSGGTAPYTFRWSGAFAGTEESISGALWADDELFLEVWDSAGRYILVNFPITTCPQFQFACSS